VSLQVPQRVQQGAGGPRLRVHVCLQVPQRVQQGGGGPRLRRAAVAAEGTACVGGLRQAPLRRGLKVRPLQRPAIHRRSAGRAEKSASAAAPSASASPSASAPPSPGSSMSLMTPWKLPTRGPPALPLAAGETGEGEGDAATPTAGDTVAAAPCSAWPWRCCLEV